MCGIAGVIGGQDPDCVERVRAMVRGIHHRGPDASGVTITAATDGSVAVLGAVRLRIIDVAPSGDQPLTDASGHLHVCFNGEIYNFRELRESLKKRGHVFRTSTDTECLIHLYEDTAGDVARIANELRGMFAFVIWDSRTGRAVAARDRLGIKPFFWVRTSSGFAFCSEQRSLVSAGFTSKTLNLRALGGYLAKGVVPNGASIFEGVQRLPPGGALEWRDHDLRETQWWEPPEPDPSITPRSAREQLADALSDSTRRHLVADRPVGVFLSSGLDSRIVATLAARFGQVRTLTVGFPDNPGSDEAVDAQRAADALALPNDTVAVSSADTVNLVDPFLKSLDSPSADGFNTWLVCRAAKEAGLVVVLSGVGGDELFSGYRTFEQVPRLRLFAQGTQLIPQSVRLRAGSRLSTHRRTRHIGKALEAGPSMSSAYHTIRSIFPVSIIHAAGLPHPALYETPRSDDSADTVMRLEIDTYLRDQLLPDADSTSMSHSLELRVPLLDDHVVDAALRFPAGIRGRRKRLLADAAGIISPPPKRPFALPFEAWLRGSLREYVRSSLLEDDLPLGDVLPHKFRHELWASFEREDSHWSQVWTVATIRRWAHLHDLPW